MVNCMTAADGVKLRSQEVVQYSTSRTAAVTTVGRSKPAVASPYACYLGTGGAHRDPLSILVRLQHPAFVPKTSGVRP